MIYESQNKNVLARNLKEHAEEVLARVPPGYFWSTDHMDPSVIPHSEMDAERLKAAAERLETVKKAELLCGLSLDPSDPAVADGDKLIEIIGQTFETLLPLYRISF